jgi:hypothetical protein
MQAGCLQPDNTIQTNQPQLEGMQPMPIHQPSCDHVTDVGVSSVLLTILARFVY